ncbi:MAG: aminoacyl-tRNA hydrolase [Clostridia bacterium]
MKIIIGLGNPEKKYDKTYHNVGFMALDELASKLSITFKVEKYKSLIAETQINNEKILLVKPLTYMNNSGEAVREVLRYTSATVADIIVVYDDVDIVAGTLRLRESGSAGTHNGMRNIIELIGTQEFKRLRIATGPKPDHIELATYVLSKIKDENIFKSIDRAVNALVELINGEPFTKILQNLNIDVK